MEKETKLQVPFHHIGGVVCFGDIMMSPAAMHRYAEDGRFIALSDRNGRFKARVEGPVSGNVLLRCAQYEAMRDPVGILSIARNMEVGKIQNSRQIVFCSTREASDPVDVDALRTTTNALGNGVIRLPQCENF